MTLALPRAGVGRKRHFGPPPPPHHFEGEAFEGRFCLTSTDFANAEALAEVGLGAVFEKRIDAGDVGDDMGNLSQ